ncbi:hypothetical protein PAPYR_13025 [Paratrimastix pyriformis]|uniref:Uncharacterized protein n=1 Tax=Paratrimastix pyriformis TaxID=342808 RepID=A0ABQ8U0X5_9EUKA|nr:hypothetical protein PAPYR_13025 [Paratrimastix pyriformis]
MTQITNAAVVGTGTGVGVYLVSKYVQRILPNSQAALWTGLAAGQLIFLLTVICALTYLLQSRGGTSPSGGGSMSLGTPFNLKVTAYNDMKQQFYFYREAGDASALISKLASRAFTAKFIYNGKTYAIVRSDGAFGTGPTSVYRLGVRDQNGHDASLFDIFGANYEGRSFTHSRSNWCRHGLVWTANKFVLGRPTNATDLFIAGIMAGGLAFMAPIVNKLGLN